MEPEILKYRLKKNFTSFLKDLEPRKILSYLYQEEVFDEDDMDEVRSERTRKRQADALLLKLSQRDIGGYEVLLEALTETQPHLANILRTPIPGEETGNSRYAISEEIRPMLMAMDRLQINRVLHSQPTEHGNMHLQYSGSYSQSGSPTSLYPPPDESYPDFVKPTNWEFISKIYRPELLESVYKMTSSPRGFAVIVNVDNFDSKPDNSGEKLDKRDGSVQDAKQLVELFTSLNFEKEELIDLPKDELLSTLSKMSNYNYSNYDCFVLCIMSHGKGDFFYASDGGKITIEYVLKMFNNLHCKTLCGKPKLYFIQACRGKDTDFGTIVHDGPSANPSEHEEPPKLPEKPKHSFDLKIPKGPSTGEHADQLIAYSSVEGYSSFRNTHSGSRFIRSLVEVFREYACMEDVLSMLTRVIGKVNSQGELGRKQVPKPETTLTRKVFFWPGVKFDECNNSFGNEDKTIIG